MELNTGRNFKIALAAKSDAVEKQVDVFARDEETIVVAECKTAVSNKQKPLQSALDEFDLLKKPIADAIRRHYGPAFKPKILWLFVTENIEWSSRDKARAAQQNTKIVTERDLNYIDELSRILGPVGRHQFKATYLEGIKIPELEGRRVPAVECKIGGKTAFVFSARADDIIRVSFVNHRDLRDPRGAPSYQRLVNPNRLRKISEFLTGGGYFPNTILLNFRKRVKFEQGPPSDDKGIQFGHLYLPDAYKSCWVVDGQHRLYGCALLPASMMQPTLAFIAFNGISPAEEANLFTVINREQQKVQRRLLEELDGDLKWDSPDMKEQIAAIASRAIDLMNNQFGSPFEDKVKLPSVRDSEDRPLDLPQLRQAIISSRLIGRVSPTDKVFVPGPLYDTDKECTLDRVMASLTGYFSEIRAADSARWDAGGEGRLCNNFGVPAYIRLLAELVLHVEKRDGIDARELTLAELKKIILPLIQPVVDFIKGATEEAFRRLFNVGVGSGGIPRYFYALCSLIHANDRTFRPQGFEAYVQQLSQEQEDLANKDVHWVQNHVHEIVVSQLRKIYGPDFFDKAVTNKEIQKSAYAKRVEDDTPEKQGPEGYLDFIELKKIIESKDNWPHFQHVLDIPLPDEKKGQAKHVKWFDEINRIRRISAHPYGKRYSVADLEILKVVCDALAPIVQQH